jgi:hypothetical protein
MNTQIQDLINQSWNTVEGPPREGMEDIRKILIEDLSPIFHDFAQRIIQECAEMMPQDSLYKMVLKHFGIEK